MKKLLGVLLAIAMSWPVSATVLNNVEVVGEIQTIASDVRHQVDVDGDPMFNSGAWTRAMAGLSADLVEDVTANLMFQYGYEWGTNNKDGWGFGATGDNQVRLVNANVVLHNLLCAFDLTVGRQFYGDEDSAVMYIGPNHYNAEAGMYADALDAAKLTYADDVKSFTMLAGKIADSGEEDDFFGGVMTKYDVQAAVMGADFKYHFADALTAQVYGYNFNNMRLVDENGVEYTQERDNANMGFYGAKLAANMEAFRASAEYARNYGNHRLFKEHKPTGHMFKADIAADMNLVTARGTFYYANEQFWAFGNYTPGLIVGNKLAGDLAGYTNANGVRMFNLGFDVKPFEKWVFALDGYAFQGTHGNHAATWEADLTAKYNHNEYVQLFAGIGYAKYGNDDSYFAKEGYADANVSDPRRDNVKGQLGMLIKF